MQESGRSHSPTDILRCVNELRAAGLNNISLDLIYGLPDQTLAAWQDSLIQALALKPSHLSLYSLEVHDKTAWGQRERLGKLQRPSEESEVTMYETACQLLAEQGFEHYEIANRSLPGLASQHNRLYWQAAPCWPWAWVPTAIGKTGAMPILTNSRTITRIAKASTGAGKIPQHNPGKTPLPSV